MTLVATDADEVRHALASEYDVTCFADAASLLAALSHETAPHAILLDLQECGGSGLDACKALRAFLAGDDLPIVVLTAPLSTRDLEEVVDAGATDYVVKPYRRVELATRVRSVVRPTALREQLLTCASKERAANEAKEEFLAVVSHELRTPLNAILGWVQLLRLGKLDAAGSARAIETIERNAKLQVQLIEDVLDGSSIASGAAPLSVSKVDVRAAIRAAADSARPVLDKKLITLKLLVDGPPIWVNGDAARLQQVVSNLLSNAIKFSLKDGHVEIRTAEKPGVVDIVVQDNGVGIDPAFLSQVFDRFRQAEDASNRRYGGLGIGLALVRHFVEAHSGTVSAASDGLGKGSTFTVSLPTSADIGVVEDEVSSTKEPPRDLLAAHPMYSRHRTG